MPGGHKDRCVVPAGTADRTSGPDWARPDQAYRSANHETTGWPMAGAAASPGKNIDAAAAAAYRASLGTGRPLSERKLAAMFGTTSRRWARHRMAEARQDLVSAMEDSR
jgi:hypothetical protein